MVAVLHLITNYCLEWYQFKGVVCRNWAIITSVLLNFKKHCFDQNFSLKLLAVWLIILLLAGHQTARLHFPQQDGLQKIEVQRLECRGAIGNSLVYKSTACINCDGHFTYVQNSYVEKIRLVQSGYCNYRKLTL